MSAFSLAVAYHLALFVDHLEDGNLNKIFCNQNFFLFRISIRFWYRPRIYTYLTPIAA